MSSELRKESATVPKTNNASERVFAMLDRQKRDKPNATLVAIEGMVLFSTKQNKPVAFAANR